MTKAHMTIQDLYKIVTLSEPRFSPDGEWLAYVQTEIDRQSNGYKSAIWLARQGFQVTAIDVSPTALDIARAKQGGRSCSFVQHDFLQQPVPARDFGLVIDMGCFHTFKSPEERERFAERVSQCLNHDAYWLTVCGSCDGPELGPPRVSARDIVNAAEPFFELRT